MNEQHLLQVSVEGTIVAGWYTRFVPVVDDAFNYQGLWYRVKGRVMWFYPGELVIVLDCDRIQIQ